MSKTVEYSEGWNRHESELHVCDDCGKRKKCCYTADPYCEELSGTLHLRWMCEKCYQESVLSI